MKAEQKVKLGNGRIVEIGGLRDGSGERFVWCREGTRLVITRFAEWHGGGAEASATLRSRDLIVVGSMGAIRDAVNQLKRFHRSPIVSKPGWSGYGFVLADGRAVVAEGSPEPLQAFTPAPSMLGRSGSLEGWRGAVAAPLAEHRLASFFMMAMFGPALLRLTDRADNFGLEIAGEAGRGKTTLQLLMATAAGPALGGGYTYWRSLNSTMNALEVVATAYNDMPLILEEAGLVQGGGRTETRGQAMRELAFKLAAGHTKLRFGEPETSQFRTIFMLSTNRPIASLLGAVHAAESEAISDRLLTIPIDDRPHGIFDFCPSSYTSTGHFADDLKQAAAQHHGHALPAYVSYLANELARSQDTLRKRIAGYIAKFVRKSGANASDGSQKRVAESFGLIYAGGCLAKEADVLPDAYKCGSATLAAYNLHRSSERAIATFDDRLRSVMNHPSTVDLTKDAVGSLTDQQRSKCPAFVFTKRTGARELLVPIEYIERVFPGWRAMGDDPDVERRLKPASDRKVLERPVGPGGKRHPCYVFDVMDIQP